MGDPDPGKTGRKPDDEGLRTTYRHLHLGTQLTLILLACLFGGRWLDEKWGWSPYLTLAGAVVGIVLGIWVVAREVAKSDS